MKTGYKVSDIMVHPVLTVEPHTILRESAKLMADKKIGSLVVKENDKVIGILTEQDLARKVVALGLDSEKVTVLDVMSKNVQTIDPQEDIYTAIVEMGKNEIKHLPVVLDNELVGMISFKDIVKVEPALIEKLWVINS